MIRGDKPLYLVPMSMEDLIPRVHLIAYAGDDDENRKES